MRIQIEATDIVTTLDGVPVRVWHGTTERGVECLVYVHRLQVREEADRREFERDLKEMPVPTDMSTVPDILT